MTGSVYCEPPGKGNNGATARDNDHNRTLNSTPRPPSAAGLKRRRPFRPRRLAANGGKSWPYSPRPVIRKGQQACNNPAVARRHNRAICLKSGISVGHAGGLRRLTRRLFKGFGSGFWGQVGGLPRGWQSAARADCAAIPG